MLRRPPSRRLHKARILLLAAVCALGVPVLAGLIEGTAEASTAVSLSVDDLVVRSDVVAVATPKSRTSRWEGGRIVTYTIVSIDTPVAGVSKGDILVVRTLGGVVGDVGQKVFGEAVLPIDKPTLVFLRPLPPALASVAVAGARSVTGMEQGALPIVVIPGKVERIAQTVLSLNLVPPSDPKSIPAHTVLADRPLADAIVDIRASWTAHGKK